MCHPSCYYSVRSCMTHLLAMKKKSFPEIIISITDCLFSHSIRHAHTLVDGRSYATKIKDATLTLAWFRNELIKIHPRECYHCFPAGVSITRPMEFAEAWTTPGRTREDDWPRWNGNLRREQKENKEATFLRLLSVASGRQSASVAQPCRGKRERVNVRLRHESMRWWSSGEPDEVSSVDSYGWIRHRVPCRRARDKTSSGDEASFQMLLERNHRCRGVRPVCEPRSCSQVCWRRNILYFVKCEEFGTK